MPGPDAAARNRQNWDGLGKALARGGRAEDESYRIGAVKGLRAEANFRELGRASAPLWVAQSAAPAGGGLQLVGARCCSPLVANCYRPRANSAVLRTAGLVAQARSASGGMGDRPNPTESGRTVDRAFATLWVARAEASRRGGTHSVFCCQSLP